MMSTAVVRKGVSKNCATRAGSGRMMAVEMARTAWRGWTRQRQVERRYGEVAVVDSELALDRAS